MNKTGFIDWYLEAFDITDVQLVTTIIGNAIDYADEHFFTCDLTAWFLHDLLEEVSFADICAFCDDSDLTKDGLEQKRLGLFLHTKLQKDTGDNGDIVYTGETLEDFLFDVDGYICMEKVDEERIRQVNERLKSCGIKPINMDF